MTESGSGQTRDVDPDIAEIIEANEAGTADLMEAYERAEQYYMAASHVYRPRIVASSNTSTS